MKEERGIIHLYKARKEGIGTFHWKNLSSNGVAPLCVAEECGLPFTSSFAAASRDESVKSAGERDGSELQNLADCSWSITPD